MEFFKTWDSPGRRAFRETSLKSHYSSCQLYLNTEPRGAGIHEHCTHCVAAAALHLCSFVSGSCTLCGCFRSICGSIKIYRGICSGWTFGQRRSWKPVWWHGENWIFEVRLHDFDLRRGSGISSTILNKATNVLKLQFYHQQNVMHTACNQHRILLLAHFKSVFPSRQWSIKIMIMLIAIFYHA